MKRMCIFMLSVLALSITADVSYSAQISEEDHKVLAQVIGEKDWAGFSLTPCPGLPDGKLKMIRELYLTLGPDNSISGRGYIMVGFNGRKYTCHTRITGNLNTGNLSLSLVEKPGEGDSLPGNMYWTTASLTLTIYKDIDRPGMFVLKGTVSDGGTATFHQK